VETVVSLAPNLFYGTSYALSVLVLSKHKTNTTIQFIDASSLYKKETNKKVLTDEHFKKIMEVFDRKDDVDYFAKSVGLEEIAKNDYILSVNSYVDRKDTRELIDIAKLNTQIKLRTGKINQLCRDIDSIVAEIVT